MCINFINSSTILLVYQGYSLPLSVQSHIVNGIELRQSLIIFNGEINEFNA